MPRVSFTQNIRRHLDCPPRDLAGATLRELLDAYFAEFPGARGYILDEQGALRKHVAVFIGATQVDDRRALADAVPVDAEVWVMQALSGG